MMRTETNQLKPCPFCGGKAHTRQEVLLDGTHVGHVVYCINCKVFRRGYRMKEAIEAWNTRAEIQTQHTHCCPCGAERTCHDTGMNIAFTCSACGETFSLTDCLVELAAHPRYCPNCGAKVITGKDTEVPTSAEAVSE